MEPLYSRLPKLPGVYLFRDDRGKILYIGKAKSLYDRVGSYFRDKNLLPKTAQLVSQIVKIDHIVVESEIDALILEANLVRKNQPHFNSALKDDKSYPRIEITIKDKIPQLHFVRRQSVPGAIYFGPYPVGTEAGRLLRYLRRIFPYVSQNHPNDKICFRYHLGLCPCAEIFEDDHGRLRYLKDLRNLRDFLSGKRQTVQKRLEKEMHQASNKENFSKAADLKAKLEKIAWLTAPRENPYEYEINPNLVEERNVLMVKDLGNFVGIDYPTRTECYDISNTSGKLATGSMVVFTNGSPDKREYRRFKIKFDKNPNDPLMMQEILTRRFKRKDNGWTLPNLIVVDGGITQLKAAKMALGQNELTIPVISLAKREEEIYLDEHAKVKLPPNSPALKLVQQMRDEAHRFSRRYHFLLRSKKMLT